MWGLLVADLETFKFCEFKTKCASDTWLNILHGPDRDKWLHFEYALVFTTKAKNSWSFYGQKKEKLQNGICSEVFGQKAEKLQNGTFETFDLFSVIL